ncbi:unnamed protein product [Rhizoctonia solani]|uniref:Acyl-CoA dehydrogenase n=1 Tax=Rhizoctonia solani TaxID=456999 RepID=A0A8H2WZ23_9AGAM|nr:unnamed protein product [Rhizoctonia solani]
MKCKVSYLNARANFPGFRANHGRVRNATKKHAAAPRRHAPNPSSLDSSKGKNKQPPPPLHPFLDDPVLPALVKRLFPQSLHTTVVQELSRFGSDVNGYIRDLGQYVEPPTLIQYDHFGRRIDQLKTSEGWRQLKQVAAKEGMVSIAYDRATFGPLARVLMFIKTCLWTGDSHVVGCPMAMTDGAARALELLGTPHMKERLLPRVLSRDPHLAYTAGQWMTERPGGSDVSHTETTAHPIHPNRDPTENGSPYRLEGVKWFSSATDGQLALALAQVPNQGLGLFVVPMPDADVQLFTSDARLPFQPRNGIGIHRLKNKIGTHALPTAELTLHDTIGFLLVPSGTRPNGVRAIAPVLNITRVHSAAGSIGNLAKCLAMARSYARVRRVADPTRPGAQVLLANVPLHTATLARVQVLRHALTHFLFGVARLLGLSETETATDHERERLRLLTPVLKAFAADRAVGGMEECMAALGGLGYMEETGIGRLIRDSLVEKIWEGTINVLALDMLRAARGGAIKALCEWSRDIIARHDSEELVKALTLLESLNLTRSHARPALLLVAHIASSSYLLEHAQWSRLELDYMIAQRWIEEGGLNEAVKLVSDAGSVGREEWDKMIVYAKL